MKHPVRDNLAMFVFFYHLYCDKSRLLHAGLVNVFGALHRDRRIACENARLANHVTVERACRNADGERK